MLPKAFLARMEKLLGPEFPAFLASYDRPRNVGLRVNPLKTDAVPDLGAFGLEPVPWESRGYYYDLAARPGLSPYHEAGLYYLQEPSAMAPAGLLDVRPGMRVLDLCAAPGGQVHPTGGGAPRAGAADCQRDSPPSGPGFWPGTSSAWPWPTVWCSTSIPSGWRSGFPDISTGFWWTRPAPARACSARRRPPSPTGARRPWPCAPGGSMRFSAPPPPCWPPAAGWSTPPAPLPRRRTRAWSAVFCIPTPDFAVVPADAPWFAPWAARLGGGPGSGPGVHLPPLAPPAAGRGPLCRRAGTAARRHGRTRSRRGPLSPAEAGGGLRPGVGTGAARRRLPLLRRYGLSRPPQGCPALRGLKVLRAGLELGQLKKNRFEPAHAWALWLKSAASVVDLAPDSREAAAYLRGRDRPRQRQGLDPGHHRRPEPGLGQGATEPR